MDRAPKTAMTEPASRLKKNTPGLPWYLTYVRTFSSGKDEVPGMGGNPRNFNPEIQKGVTATQQRSSRVSSSSMDGTSGRSPAGSNARCANKSRSHCWRIHQDFSGSGHGRCSCWARISAGVIE